MTKTDFETTDSDELVQRFLDQELSAEERVRFVRRLGHDAMLRQHVIDLESMVLAASRLPRTAVPDGFVDRVLAKVAPPAPSTSTWQWLRGRLLVPRTLRWNLATAVAAACLVMLFVATLVTGRRASPSAELATAAMVPSTGASAAPSTVLVRLIVVQPGAQTVQVAGDFNGWNPVRTPLEPLSGGAWAVTIPLAPGRYEYMFVVNGQQWIADPFAVERSDDGFGSQNAVLDVRPPTGVV